MNKATFVKYMIDNGYTEGNNHYVSYRDISSDLNIATYIIDNLIKYNPDYIKDGHAIDFKSVQLTNKHKETYPEYYL